MRSELPITFIMPLMTAVAALFAVAVPGPAGPIANADSILGLDAGDAWGSERSGEVSTGVDSQEDKTSVAAQLSLEGQISNNTAPSPDFDGDGTVGFSYFLAFAGSFGSTRGDARYDARFDLDDVSFGASKQAAIKKKPELLHALGEKYGRPWPEAGGIVRDNPVEERKQAFSRKLSPSAKGENK